MTTTASESLDPKRTSAWRWLAGVLAVAFGVATLFEGGHVLFGGPAAQAEAGKVVPFVLLFNFGAGFAYVLGGLATIMRRAWAVWVARVVAVATVVVFAAFGIYVLRGGAYELRTLVAMTTSSAPWSP